VDGEGATPLHKAAFSGHYDAAKLLLENGADVAKHDYEGCTPLHKAAYSGQSKLVALLIENGAEVDAQVMNSIKKNYIVL
jgi:ankyrin repeat protein